MKRINNYIAEKLLISPQEYAYFPQTNEELVNIIRERIKNEGPNCNLNDIDVSNITDMSKLFNKIDLRYFNGNISDWDVSGVKNMTAMFAECKQFNCDISNWDVSNVEDMSFMFFNIKGFDYNISDWDVRNVKNMSYMFNCINIKNKPLSNLSKLSKWQFKKITHMNGMFRGCATFEGNTLEDWVIPENTQTKGMFDDCASAPSWYTE